MKQLKSYGYYNFTSPQQRELYSMVQDARMWQKTLAILAAFLLAFALIMTFFYSSERESKEREVARANERVLTMVEQLKSPTHASH